MPAVRHAQHHERQGENPGYEHFLLERGVEPAVLFFLFGKGVAAVDDKVVAGILYGFLQGFGTESIVVFHREQSGGEIGGGFLHAGLCGGDGFGPVRATGAMQFQKRINGLLRHGKKVLKRREITVFGLQPDGI